jgi:hypothetical protein
MEVGQSLSDSSPGELELFIPVCASLVSSKRREYRRGPSHKGTALCTGAFRSVRYSLAPQRRAAYPARPARPLPKRRTDPGSGTNSSASHGSRQTSPKVAGA